MSSEVETAGLYIPGEAKQAACNAYEAAVLEDGERGDSDDLDNHEEVIALKAAAPLIVAAELDRISPELTSAVCGKTDEWDAGWWAALDWVGQQLGSRASELRGEAAMGEPHH